MFSPRAPLSTSATPSIFGFPSQPRPLRSNFVPHRRRDLTRWSLAIDPALVFLQVRGVLSPPCNTPVPVCLHQPLTTDRIRASAFTPHPACSRLPPQLPILPTATYPQCFVTARHNVDATCSLRSGCAPQSVLPFRVPVAPLLPSEPLLSSKRTAPTAFNTLLRCSHTRPSPAHCTHPLLRCKHTRPFRTNRSVERRSAATLRAYRATDLPLNRLACHGRLLRQPVSDATVR
jgi:hypothetical protein